VQTGRLNLEFLDFTVVGVPSLDALTDDSLESVQAAEAAACAAEQDAYLAYRDWLFEGPSRLSNGDFSDDNLINASAELGLDVDQFSASLQAGVYEQGIIESLMTGLDRGVQGTPAMRLNGGEPFYVPQDGFDGLRRLLDEELN
jgi:protein-disulfide isomerase